MCDIVSQCAHLNRCESAHTMLFHSVGCHRQPGSTHTHTYARATSRAGCRGRCRRYTTHNVCARDGDSARVVRLRVQHKMCITTGCPCTGECVQMAFFVGAVWIRYAHAMRYTRRCTHRPITCIIRKCLIPLQCAVWLLLPVSMCTSLKKNTCMRE